MSRTKRSNKDSGRAAAFMLILTFSEFTAILIKGRIPLYAMFYVRVAIGTAVFYIAGLILLRLINKSRLSGASIRKIDMMTGEEFEQYLGILYTKAGYRVKYTPGTMDFGADLIISKNGLKSVVQAKRYKSQVGEAAVQQAYSGKGYYEADICLVVTNSTFTYAAKELAKKTGVVLIDRWKIGSKEMYP